MVGGYPISGLGWGGTQARSEWWGGGTPSQVWGGGYPISGMGGTLARSGWWGVPWPGLDGVGTWGIPSQPSLDSGGAPRSGLDGGGGYLGYPSPLSIEA